MRYIGVVIALFLMGLVCMTGCKETPKEDVSGGQTATEVGGCMKNMGMNPKGTPPPAGKAGATNAKGEGE